MMGNTIGDGRAKGFSVLDVLQPPDSIGVGASQHFGARWGHVVCRMSYVLPIHPSINPSIPPNDDDYGAGNPPPLK